MLAYEQLLDEGYAQARTGSGTIVAPTLPEDWGAPIVSMGPGRRAQAAPVEPRLSRAGDRAVEVIGASRVYRETHSRHASYDFRAGRPSFGDFPRTVWCRLLGRRARSASWRDLDYGPPEGRRELREALAERLRRVRGIETTARQVVIVNGSQQALDLITRVLVDPGDRVLIEEPH
jgi:GntR family transcriptional regulator/MocR family aminotransferase